ncbi:DUF1152 domain-containing protein [Amycolatopsis sp. BJA-103]|uniref:DUF1152 domain-containing protein n=1 Tax=Amycolatopsis sp. BJA-103 TaxID=1911175 RepID=UPI000C769CC9|nr:DUF1152 domain-containing protein [Amycolatopsis sp. BJA-103]AUI64547.1 hypothetical protein BKN51_19680 [Amycolatopsis sp. BJA-103]PNE13662.1 hypothetical protein B1H26_39735 [Amycolatopsis sp. BJA-103]
MFSLTEPPLFARLKSASNVLLAGAGGGFDVYAALPLAFALRAQGKRVHLANLSFSELARLDLDDWVAPDVAAVGADSVGSDDYFPERTLARWLRDQGLPSTVHAFPRTGVRRLRAAYRALVRHLGVDAIVLVDGGTDILMRGDESGLGTPEEDMTSLAAVSAIEDVDRLVACLGFGIDSYHGVCHSHVLENLAALDRAGGYLGALSIPSASPEAQAYRDAVAHAQAATPIRPSIVNGQIAAALRGEFGNVAFTSRTAGSELFVNPLMGMYFTVDLRMLAASVGYLDRLRDTETMLDVARAITDHRDTVLLRPGQAFPH